MKETKLVKVGRNLDDKVAEASFDPAHCSAAVFVMCCHECISGRTGLVINVCTREAGHEGWHSGTQNGFFGGWPPKT